MPFKGPVQVNVARILTPPTLAAAGGQVEVSEVRQLFHHILNRPTVFFGGDS
jgi:hypothetical protein